MRERALEGLERLVDGRDRAVDTQHAGELLRVGKRRIARIGAGHRDAMHVGRAERVDRNRGHDRGVNATGQPDNDIGKPFFCT